MDTPQQMPDGQPAATDTLFLLSGAALVLFGAGLILSNQTVRRYLGRVGVGDLMQVAAPDVERYLKLRNM